MLKSITLSREIKRHYNWLTKAMLQILCQTIYLFKIAQFNKIEKSAAKFFRHNVLHYYVTAVFILQKIL